MQPLQYGPTSPPSKTEVGIGGKSILIYPNHDFESYLYGAELEDVLHDNGNLAVYDDSVPEYSRGSWERYHSPKEC